MAKGDLNDLPRVPDSPNRLERVFDAISARYGWTDHYLLYELPYARLCQVARRVCYERSFEEQQRRVNFALVGYLNYCCTPLKKGKRHVSFQAYCRRIGVTAPTRGLSSAVVSAERQRADALLKKALGRRWGEMELPKKGLVK